MRIVVVGATGTIGQAVVAALAGHDVVAVTRHSAISVDLADSVSIGAMFGQIGEVDAIVSVAGAARFKPFAELTDDDFAFSVANKLLGQVNLLRRGLSHVRDGGSITLTGGSLGQAPAPGSGAVSMVNAGLEGFTRAAALEAPRGIRINIVSPPWVTETLQQRGMTNERGLPASVVARAYVDSITGSQTGTVIAPRDSAS